MTNLYACMGPSLDQYASMLKLHGNNANMIIAGLRGLKKEQVKLGTLQDMKNVYTQHELFRASGAVYEFWTWDTHQDEPEVEVYPNATWLTLMQSPRMNPTVIQEMDKMFQRMTSDHEATDNYCSMSVLWRGLETRVIAQTMTANDTEGVPEGHVIFRPEWLAIDPFLLTRLKPASEGMKTSDEVMRNGAQKLTPREKSVIDTGPIPSNVIDMIKGKKD